MTGGANWPGSGYDPETHKLYIYSKTEPSVFPLYSNGDKAASDFNFVVTETATEPALVPRGRFNPGDVSVDDCAPALGKDHSVRPDQGVDRLADSLCETPDEVRNHPRLKGLTIARTGRPGLLGVLVTRTLVICGEAGFFTTPDGRRGAMLRAYCKDTGAEKGAVYIPAPQSGSPMTYMAKGQQYLVIAVSGGRYSAELIAYRLPAF